MRPVTSTSYADSLKQEIEPVKTARQKHINYCCKSLKGFSDGSLLVSKTKFFFFLREQIRNSKNEEKL